LKVDGDQRGLEEAGEAEEMAFVGVDLEVDVR